jgi:hypothetical protein
MFICKLQELFSQELFIAYNSVVMINYYFNSKVTRLQKEMKSEIRVLKELFETKLNNTRNELLSSLTGL